MVKIGGDSPKIGGCPYKLGRSYYNLIKDCNKIGGCSYKLTKSCCIIGVYHNLDECHYKLGRICLGLFEPL